MLPNLRAVLAAIVAAVGLLVGTFALVAILRVAQENRTGPLHADLVQRSRTLAVPASIEPRAIAPVEKPAPLEPNPVQAVEMSDAVEIPPPIVAAAPHLPATEPIEPPADAPTQAAVTDAAPPLPAPAAVTEAVPPAEPPMGGPLPEHALATHTAKAPGRIVDHAAAKRKAKQEAARKARAARLARLARERKAAARKARAAQGQAQTQQQTFGVPNNTPFGSFGNFGNNSFGR